MRQEDLKSKYCHFQPFNAGFRLSDNLDGGNIVLAHSLSFTVNK